MMTLVHSTTAALALFQSTQLNVFERFLNQAVAGIDSTSITSGMQNVGYVVLLVGFLWQVYQAALHGGDVRGLGTNLIKYVVTAIVVMNYHAIFTTLNQGFVNSGNWVSSASGASNLFDNWANDLKTQFNQVGFQKLWGLVSADIAGLIDAVLIIVAYVLYPVVIVIFGFFYMLYGTILYIFGPVVIALMPLGATNRLAKSYAENVFIWNAWPVLYGGFGALLSAVQMGQIGQMLDQNSFLGGLGNLEGSILIGLASIIYSLAIAVIPFIAKRIVSGEVGSTAGAIIGAAATALSAGIAGAEGVSAGLASSSGASTTGQSIAGTSSASSASQTVGAMNNRPNAAQRVSSADAGASSWTAAPGTAGELVADGIRGSFSGALGNAPSSASDRNETHTTAADAPSEGDGRSSESITTNPARSGGRVGTSGRGPTPALARPRGLATWGTYHVARIATKAVVGGVRASRDVVSNAASSRSGKGD